MEDLHNTAQWKVTCIPILTHAHVIGLAFSAGSNLNSQVVGSLSHLMYCEFNGLLTYSTKFPQSEMS